MTDRRPPLVSLAAALTVGMGLFMGLTAAAGAVGIVFGDDDHPAMEAHGDEAPDGVALAWVARHARLWTTGHAALAVAAIACGVGVWSGRSWARRSSQFVMALCSALFVISGAVLASSFQQPFREMGAAGGIAFFVWRAAALGVSLIWASVTALPVWLLARQEARDWAHRR